MKLAFLGTGAADWDFRKKEEYLKERGEFRRLSSTLINDELLMDPGPHIFDAEETFGISLGKVKIVLITHSHDDHYNEENVFKLADRVHPVFFGDVWAKYKLEMWAKNNGRNMDEVDFRPIEADEVFECDGYHFVSFHSNHSTEFPDEKTRNYAVTDPEGTKLFYGLDSGPFRYEMWEKMRGSEYDIMIHECTTGDVPGDDRIYGHTALPWLLYSEHALRKTKTVKEGAPIYIDHMALTLHGPQETIEQYIHDHGSDIHVAYDGLRLEI